MIVVDKYLHVVGAYSFLASCVRYTGVYGYVAVAFLDSDCFSSCHKLIGLFLSGVNIIVLLIIASFLLFCVV